MDNLATSRNRRRVGRRRGINQVKKHLGLELVFMFFVFGCGNCIPATFPTLGGSISSGPAPYFPRHNRCGSGGLQCTIFEQNSCERDSIAPAKGER